jgi:hypothetical protein
MPVARSAAWGAAKIRVHRGHKEQERFKLVEFWVVSPFVSLAGVRQHS